MLEPILFAVAIVVFGCRSFRRVPVGPLPSGCFAEAGSICGQTIVQGGASNAAGGLGLTEGPMHGVEQAKRLDCPVMKVKSVALEGHHATNVDVPKIHGRMTVDDPIGQHLACASG